MDITIHYTTQLRAIVGLDTEKLAVHAGATVLELLRLLCERRGDSFRAMVLPDGDRTLLLVCINDVQVADIARHRLHDGDEVLLLSPISGG